MLEPQIAPILLVVSILQQLETLKKVMDNAHEGQIKEVTARHEK